MNPLRLLKTAILMPFRIKASRNWFPFYCNALAIKCSIFVLNSF